MEAPARGPRTPARETLRLRAWSLRHIPLLFFLSPTIVALDPRRAVVRVPLNWRTRNHLGSMYFGALCTGADCAVAVLALHLLEGRQAVVPIFKDMRVEFLARAEGDVHFACEEGERIRGLFDRAGRSSERESAALHVVATVPAKMGDVPVARFELTLSAKKRGASRP
jgi:acyl-coenzyme A thioesterase PaaI-like protein